MSDKEKFEGFKEEYIRENERKYGKEIRKKYGDEAIDASNEVVRKMTKENRDDTQALSDKFNETLIAAVQEGNPAGALAMEACDLHRKWLCRYWKAGMYSKAAHLAMGESYVADERFKAYYDNLVSGGAEFLLEALKIYCAE